MRWFKHVHFASDKKTPRICEDKQEILEQPKMMPLTKHREKVEFGNLIPGKICFWREIFATLRGNVSFRWIFQSFLTKKEIIIFWKKC